MKILLDIDDTLINHKDELHPRHKELFDNNEIILFSASADIEFWAEKFNVKFIHKNENIIPEADVLIDDIEAFKHCVKVEYYFKSINEFLNSAS